ncbi:Uncharacterised protein [Salmonella enterica subsp. enterica serovar Bovismorbificans]|uniref:Uncharacterized protein n=1 Tax=Salmonella enterica subsp. enterica serovar Bovismorbificans TaxID=58097 RepID=A0A655BRR9_SALET|nr:Uncharacterised protein [Salmonella enterica subsp. enterica serovar Bovismorbificans]
MALIKSVDKRGQKRKGKGIIHTDDQFVLPAFMQFNRLLFQLANGVQHFTAFFQ